MLILSRKQNETIYVGDEIVIKVVKIKGNVVGLGIDAPKNVKVLRSELAQPEAKDNSSPANSKQPSNGPLSAFMIAS